jgi:hypothetical protein
VQAVLRLDAIAATPVTFGELDVVEQNELVGRPDQIEIALPRDVAGLNDRDAFVGHSLVNRRVYHAGSGPSATARA